MSKETYFMQTDLQYGTAGTINEELKFDGYTCIDNKEKLYLPRTDSYAYTKIMVNQSTNSYTLEFWFKAQAGMSGENYLISLSDSPRSQTRQYLSVLLEADNILSCYPSLNSTP